MISTAYEPMLACIVKIGFELAVYLAGALSGLDHHKTNGTILNNAIVAQFVPINGALIMAYVYAMNLITTGIASLAIESLSTESKWSNKEIIKRPHISYNHQYSAQPPSPSRHDT